MKPDGARLLDAGGITVDFMDAATDASTEKLHAWDIFRCPVYEGLHGTLKSLIIVALNRLRAKPAFIFPALIRAYFEADGRIVCPGPLHGLRGVHPMTAFAIFYWVERMDKRFLGDVFESWREAMVADNPQAESEFAAGLGRAALPRHDRRLSVDARQILGWACHRYLPVSYSKLARSTIFNYLSEDGREVSTRRTVGRVAQRIGTQAAAMGVTIKAT